MVSNHNSLALEKDVASKITFATRQCRTESHLSVNPPTTTPTTDQITSGRKDAEVGSGATRQPHPLDSISTDKTLDDNAWVHTLDATSAVQARPPIADHHAHSPSCAGLRVQTDLTTIEESARPSSGDSGHISSTPGLPIRTPSVKVALHASSNTGGSLSPSSTFSSPGLGPLVAITPLPSPIVLSGSSGLWRKPEDRPDSRGSMRSSERISVMPSHDMTSSTRTSPKKRRVYHGVSATTSDPYGTSSQADRDSGPSHGRNRSLSEYVPEAISIPPHRNVVVSGSGGPPGIQTLSPPDQPLHREEYLAVQRGLALAVARPPTPPRSNRSGAESDEGSSPVSKPRRPQKSLPIYFEARTVKTNKKRSWRAIRQLGKGTFSEVMLATSQGERRGQKSDRVEDEEIPLNEEQLDPRTLIAVKIIEHGPAGGASAERVATSLKRELDILLSIHHPSLVHLKAFSLDPQQALLVLNYCPGGDLFELASLKHDLLVPALIQRIFAELVAAVRYLHEQYIVHRDIKLENVLLNLPRADLPTIADWQHYSAPVVTLTDLGLSRRIPRPPESSLLETPCGSQDYAAPELLMGQPYDGRATDAWALGVLLYALMEGRLPFDPLPGARGDMAKLIERTPHRVARCEWRWVKWADRDGEWDTVKGKALEGGKECVEGLLKRARTRMTLDTIGEIDWVKKGLKVEGSLARVGEEDDEA